MDLLNAFNLFPLMEFLIIINPLDVMSGSFDQIHDSIASVDSAALISYLFVAILFIVVAALLLAFPMSAEASKSAASRVLSARWQKN